MIDGFRVATLLATLAIVIAGGTVFFHWAEGWSWLDSYFFTVITLSTVGYGSLVPVTAVGKIGTTVFIIVGLGIFAVAIQQFGAFAMRKREEHVEWLVRHMTTHEDAAQSGSKPDTGPDDPR